MKDRELREVLLDAEIMEINGYDGKPYARVRLKTIIEQLRKELKAIETLLGIKISNTSDVVASYEE
jgi:hypothetical protein